MTETTVVHADLDLLAERVEKAAALVTRLKEDNQRLERESREAASRLQDTQHSLQGQDPSALLSEVAALKREQKQWESERREVAARIETLLKKLERLES